MTTGRSGGGPAAVTAARHLEDFGFTGWHLIRSANYDPARDTLAGPESQFERQMVEAVGYFFDGVPAREDSTVFFVAGKPRPRVGDGLVALTRHWLIKRVDVLNRDGDGIYALLCV